MKFHGKFVTLSIDINKYKKQAEKYLEKELKNVIRAWLFAVVGRVPVWSGMARGSLLSVSELVNGGLVITPVQHVTSRISLGEKLGTIEPNFKFADFKVTIITNVEHYNVQEYYNVNVSKSAPWRSLEAGLQAASFASQSVRLPRPRLYHKTLKL
jgi:hypothetical protein